jgi:hypothetical protein
MLLWCRRGGENISRERAVLSVLSGSCVVVQRRKVVSMAKQRKTVALSNTRTAASVALPSVLCSLGDGTPPQTPIALPAAAISTSLQPHFVLAIFHQALHPLPLAELLLYCSLRIQLFTQPTMVSFKAVPVRYPSRAQLTLHSPLRKQACPRAGRSAGLTQRICHTTSTRRRKTRDGSRRRGRTRRSSRTSWPRTIAPRVSRPQRPRTRATRSGQLICLLSIVTADAQPAGGNPRSRAPTAKRKS